MNYNSLFKLLIDIAFYLLIPLIFLFPGAILYTLVFPSQEIIKLTTRSISPNGWLTSLILLSIYAEYVLFFVGFYNLRKFAALLLKNRIFTKASVQCAKKIGQFFTICGTSSLLLKLIYALLLSTEYEIEFGISDIQLYLFLTVIGVFFLILSIAFERALSLKEENKLTA
jgi:hypothetical protein